MDEFEKIDNQIIAPRCSEEELAAFAQGFDSFAAQRELNSEARYTASLIGLGFRCWLTGFNDGNERLYELCCQKYIQRFGPRDGIVLSHELGIWTETLATSSSRAFKVFAGSSIGFSHDEVLAISMVAAAQHSECPALRSCIYAITERAAFDQVEDATDTFAQCLAECGHILSTETITFPLLHLADGGHMQH